LVAAGRRALGYDAPEPSDVYQKARELELAKNAYGRNEFGELPRFVGGLGAPAALGSIYNLATNDEGAMEAQRAKEDDARYAAILRALQGYAPSGVAHPYPNLFSALAATQSCYGEGRAIGIADAATSSPDRSQN
jgi:hypothetical protein